MKKLFFLTALCLALLCACAGNQDVYEVTYDGTVYTVDTVNCTISFDGAVCQFSVSANSTVRITYPDGSSYWWTQSGNVGYGGWSDDYDPDRYQSGETLLALLQGERLASSGSEGRKSGGNPLLGLLFVALGIFNVAAPRAAWTLSYGWRYKNAEPSDAALGVGRVGGVVAIFIGIICFFA